MAEHLLDFQPGAVLLGTPYRVVKHVGSGGMGEVHEVEHVRLKKRLIVKTVHPGLRARSDYLKRMEVEAQTLARIAHPNIVQVHDLGVTDDGIPFFVMEKLEGIDARKLLRSKRYLDLPDAIRIIEDVLEGLAHAHREGIVHRDIKPENIFLAKSGADTVTKILDFGIVHVVDDPTNLTGERFLGTCQYASPEHLRGDKPNEKMDLYAVGCMLFELIAGRRPFLGPETPDFIRQHLNDPAPRISSIAHGVPPALDALIASALDKDPAKRPISALWFASQLHQIHQVAQHVELAQANTTEEMLLTAITAGAPSSSGVSAAKQAEDTQRDAALPAALGETTPQPAPPAVTVREGNAPVERAKTPRMSTEEHFRRAKTRTGQPVPYVKTEELPVTQPLPLPAMRPEAEAKSAPRRARSAAAASGDSIVLPMHASWITRGWRRKAIIAMPLVVSLALAVGILVYGQRPSSSAASAPSSSAPSSLAMSATSSSSAVPVALAPNASPSPAVAIAGTTPVASTGTAQTIARQHAAPKTGAPERAPMSAPPASPPATTSTATTTAPSPSPSPATPPAPAPRDDLVRTL